NTMKATATGKSPSQQNSISWSYFSRGSVARNQTNKKQKKLVFIPKIKACKFIKDSFTKISGILYPPKKKIAEIVLNKTIELYSPKKKKTKRVAECSVKKPATSSDSASCKSKGVLEVSASTEMKK
ncbi:unnamed protein product, partial [Mycena citricolor]